jgi:hypothetical protein
MTAPDLPDPAVTAAQISRQQASDQHTYALDEALYNAYIDVTKGVFDRVSSASDFVATAAAAVGTVYTALLGLSFGIGKDVNRPLPVRGIASAVFLGFALALAVANRAFITKPPPGDISTMGTADVRTFQMQQLNRFIAWANDNATRRRIFLQMAVLSLSAGVALLPLPFIDIPNGLSVGVIMLAVVLVIAIPTGIQVSESRAE